nr:DUF1906 domain-containing protein [Allomuricauda sp.]
MDNFVIIDTAQDTSGQLDCLKKVGIQTVIRYYDHGNSPIHPSKRLELGEAQALSKNGFQIVVVYQTVQNKKSDFSRNKGLEAGQTALLWAKETIGQPSGSAIYFAVDYDAPPIDLENNVIPYFEGVQQVLQQEYTVGAYGSGLVTNTLKERGLCSYRWLSESSSYYGTRKAQESGNYELQQIYVPNARLCTLDVDFDSQNPAVTDIGAFTLKSEIAGGTF